MLRSKPITRLFCCCQPLGALAAVVLLSLSCFSQAAPQAADAVAPEQSSGYQQQQAQRASRFIVATANPHATEVGYRVLQDGGNAIDAMVAVQAVLGLVEPQSSGLGGGAFLVYYDATTGQLKTFDGRETAPATADERSFIGLDGKPLAFYDAVVGGLSVGVPGTVKLLDEVHQRFGREPWLTLLQPAEKLAREGFAISPRLASAIAGDAERLSRFPDTARYFLNTDGSPKAAGTLLKNVAYADTLKQLQLEQAEAFYHGELAHQMVQKVLMAPTHRGHLALSDLSHYEIKQRPAVCAPYHEYEVCGMGPPSSGALTIGQALMMLESFDLAQRGPEDPVSWQIIGDASRLAFADRGRYMADSDFVEMPEGLLDPNYMQQRAKLITPGQALAEVLPGQPPGTVAQWADDESLELPSTSHFVIVDAEGNVVSMTTTIENSFGSRLMAGGFLLNNELTDFSFVPERNGKPVANRVEPGKRPRSSMSPTIVMKDGEPYLAIGSPGGSRIIGYVLKSLVAQLDWGMDIQAAIDLPNRVNRFGVFDLEKGTTARQMAQPLTRMGFKVEERELNSGLQGVLISDQGLEGGADPRREGKVMGE